MHLQGIIYLDWTTEKGLVSTFRYMWDDYGGYCILGTNLQSENQLEVNLSICMKRSSSRRSICQSDFPQTRDSLPLELVT